MAIRVVVFDIGGILEVIPEGGDPTVRYPVFEETWTARLGLAPGELAERLGAFDEDGAFGRCTYAEWCARVQHALGISDSDFGAFLADFWDIYMGYPNDELIAWFRALRPRYRTAILSNSFVGAREQEEQRYGFTSMVELAIYSHEEGVRKPDPRIFALLCERLGCQPDEIVFLDDVERNVEAATAYGIHAILFQNNAQAIAAIEALLNGSSAV